MAVFGYPYLPQASYGFVGAPYGSGATMVDPIQGGGGFGGGSGLGSYFPAQATVQSSYNQLLGTQYGWDTQERMNQLAQQTLSDNTLRQLLMGRYLGELDSGTQRYLGDVGLQGTQYTADRSLEQALGVAGIQDLMNRYIADQSLAGQLGVANIGLQGTRYSADKALEQALGVAGLETGAQRYASELGLQGVGLQTGAQRYGSELGLQGLLGSTQMQSASQDLASRLGLQGTGLETQAARDVAGIQGQSAENVARINAGTNLGTAQLGALASMYGSAAGAGADRFAATQQRASAATDAAQRAHQARLGLQSDYAGYQNALQLGAMSSNAQKEAARLNNIASIIDQQRKVNTTNAMLSYMNRFIPQIVNSATGLLNRSPGVGAGAGVA